MTFTDTQMLWLVTGFALVYSTAMHENALPRFELVGYLTCTAPTKTHSDNENDDLRLLRNRKNANHDLARLCHVVNRCHRWCFIVCSRRGNSNGKLVSWDTSLYSPIAETNTKFKLLLRRGTITIGRAFIGVFGLTNCNGNINAPRATSRFHSNPASRLVSFPGLVLVTLMSVAGVTRLLSPTFDATSR
jgi:hypothetical protein